MFFTAAALALALALAFLPDLPEPELLPESLEPASDFLPESLEPDRERLPLDLPLPLGAFFQSGVRPAARNCAAIPLSFRSLWLSRALILSSASFPPVPPPRADLSLLAGVFLGSGFVPFSCSLAAWPRGCFCDWPPRDN